MNNKPFSSFLVHEWVVTSVSRSELKFGREIQPSVEEWAGFSKSPLATVLPFSCWWWINQPLVTCMGTLMLKVIAEN